MGVSVYLKGQERFPDPNYVTRLQEFSQSVNPKENYVAPVAKIEHIVDWELTFHTPEQDITVDAHGIYLDAIIHRAARNLPWGFIPEDGQEMTVTFKAKKK